MTKIILFNHIPKTGGTTLRIILNRVYGEDKVYFPSSKDLASSLKQFESFSKDAQQRFSVIAGHATMDYTKFFEQPFYLTILRNPVDLFLSQYNYLKTSPNSIFQKEIAQLGSLEAYLPFAVNHGQDNLMTRYLSNSVDWLVRNSKNIPDLEREGNRLLGEAKSNLTVYDAVLDLANFDCGIYSLRKSLEWKSIPLYRPVNKSKNKKKLNYRKEVMEKINYLLRFDIDLYNYFQKEKLDSGLRIDTHNSSYKQFMLRQKVINKVF